MSRSESVRTEAKWNLTNANRIPHAKCFIFNFYKLINFPWSKEFTLESGIFYFLYDIKGFPAFESVCAWNIIWFLYLGFNLFLSRIRVHMIKVMMRVEYFETVGWENKKSMNLWRQRSDRQVCGNVFNLMRLMYSYMLLAFMFLSCSY